MDTICNMTTEEERNSEVMVGQWTLEYELAKNEQLHKKDFEALREFCSTLPGVDISIIPDNVVVALLHSSEYDMEKARYTATKYFELRFSIPEVFNDRDIDSDRMKTALEVGSNCPLPKKTADGYRIMIQSLRRKDPSLYDSVGLFKVQLLTLDTCVYEDPTCPGYIFVGDMEGVSMSHLWKNNLSVTKKMMQFTQAGCPIRLIQMHMLNTSWFTYYLMRFMKPFVSNSLYEMVQFYTSDQMDDFHKVISKECLPEDYGGDLPKLDDLCDEQIEWLRRMQPIVDPSSVKNTKL